MRALLPLINAPYDSTTMKTISLVRAILLPWSQTASVERAVGEIVSECHGRMSQMIGRLRAAMTPDETRGYVRAYALQCVSDDADEVLHRHHLRRGCRSKLLAMAIDRLVDLVAGEIKAFDRVSAVSGRPLAA